MKVRNKRWVSLKYSLRDAVQNNLLEEVKYCVDDLGADVNAKITKDKITPLHTAALCGMLKMTKLLLELGSDIQARDIKGRTATEYAVINGHTRIASFLKSEEKKLNFKISKTEEPLPSLPKINIQFKLATDNEAASTQPKKSFKDTPIGTALNQNNFLLAAGLIESGLYDNEIVGEEEILLDIAAHHGHVALASLMISRMQKSRNLETKGVTK